MNTLIEIEASVRLAAFLSIFALMAIWEILAPRRELSIPKGTRWLNNLGLVVVNTLVIRFIFPAAAVGTAIWTETHSIGLIHRLDMSQYWWVAAASVVLLDLFIWYQHLLFHKIPMFWRLHRVHHADLDFDLTTGLRFHPLEVVLSMFIKAALILIFGFPAIAVLLFEIILNGCAMITHSNVRLPNALDAALRTLFVTPDMHRVHHSWRIEEANSNYGFNLAIWDKLFGTYRADSVDGQLGITFGISQTPNRAAVPLWKLLTLPFRSQL
jgi:sterol desaturase/sphingolipid hydroxylase (fatty acid hydroxylase superfamily)